ncbi:MAG: putative signal transducing protein [Bacillota bacterium]
MVKTKDENWELVTIYETGNPVLIAIIKSILDDAAIRYLAKGEGLQNLFALGAIGGNPLIGPVKIQVNREDEEIARELLKDLE